jgi:hypothetical protein
MTKDEAKLFPSRKIDPHEIPLRRAARINGIFEHYERIGDEFIELHEIARQLSVTVSDFSYEAAIQHFKFSVKLGGFPAPGTGFREYRVQGRLVRRAVKDLLDLHNFDRFEPADYPLRPSTLTAQTSPQAMRARRSVWVRWIRAKGLPMPPELAAGIMIEHEPARRRRPRRLCRRQPRSRLRLRPNRRAKAGTLNLTTPRSSTAPGCCTAQCGNHRSVMRLWLWSTRRPTPGSLSTASHAKPGSIGSATRCEIGRNWEPLRSSQ